MTNLDNAAYFLSRAAQARLAADTAQSPRVAGIHTQLAALYEDQASLADGIAATQSANPPEQS